MNENVSPRVVVVAVVVVVLAVAWFGYRTLAPAKKTPIPPQAAQMMERAKQGMQGSISHSGSGPGTPGPRGGMQPGMPGGPGGVEREVRPGTMPPDMR